MSNFVASKIDNFVVNSIMDVSLEHFTIRKNLKSPTKYDLSVDTILDEIKKNSNSFYYEVIDGPCKAYIDYDEKLNNNEDYKKKRKDFIKLIQESIKEPYILIDGCRIKKNYPCLSFHIILQNKIYKDGVNAERYIKSLKLPFKYDPAVYKAAGKQQLFRLPYCGKNEEDLKYMYILDEGGKRIKLENLDPKLFSKCFVSVGRKSDSCDLFSDTEDETEYIEMPEPEPEPEQKSIKLDSSVDDKFKNKNNLTPDAINELLDCLLDEQGKQNFDWDKWTRIVWILSNISRKWSFDLSRLVHDFSMKSDKYDKIQTDKIYYNEPKNKNVAFIGSLIKMAKENNIEKFDSWNDKWMKKNKKSKKKKTELEPELIEVDEKEIKYFDFYEKYYYKDFIEELQSEERELSDLYVFVKKNVNRVILRLIDESMFIKKDEKHLIEDARGLSLSNVRYFTITKEGIKDGKTSVASLVITCIDYLKSYNNLVFQPSMNVSDRDFNIWSGFKAKYIQEYDISKIQGILNHIKEVWANNNEGHYHYILSWLHHVFKYPNKKTKVAMVLRSQKQQIGKGIIVEEFLMPYVFGVNISYYDSGLDFLTQRFNQFLMNKVFVCADELSAINGSFHNTFDVLKSLITGKMMSIEIKGGRKFDIQNHMNLIMLTNNAFTIKVEQNDARYAVFDCNNDRQGQYEYFNELYKTFNEETANVFFSYIYDLENPVDVRNIPETQIKKDMKINCLSSPKRFLHSVKEFIDDMKDLKIDSDSDEFYELESWKRLICYDDYVVKAGILYNSYKLYCEEENEKPLSNTRFGREIKDNIEKERKMNGICYDLKSINNL